MYEALSGIGACRTSLLTHNVLLASEVRYKGLDVFVFWKNVLKKDSIK
jgi:hypothetical protein